MKKILIFLFIILYFASSVQAKTIKVISLKHFSTEFPSPTFQVQTIQKETITRGFTLEAGTIISGIVLKSESPKLGSRDGYFEFIPTTITSQGATYNITHATITAKVLGYKPVDPQKLIVNIAQKTANILLKGAITGLDFAQGAIEAQDGQRIKSGTMRAYKNSFLSYIEAGDALDIKRGDLIILKIKTAR